MLTAVLLYIADRGVANTIAYYGWLSVRLPGHHESPFIEADFMKSHIGIRKSSVLWNKGRLVGQKAPLKSKEIWAIRIRLQLVGKARD